MPLFSDENIESLFGAEDAENESIERFKQYFFFNDVYTNIRNELPIRIIVGHKGVGKSALLKRSFLQDTDDGRVSLWLRPDDYLNLSFSDSHVDFNRQVESIKSAMIALIARRLLGEKAEGLGKADTVLSDIGGKISERIVKFIQKLGQDRSISFDDIITQKFFKDKKVTVYIDDIDRGWYARRQDIANISALLNAIRDISGVDRNIMFRIGLRTDVWYLVRTSDESTDKLERNIVWLEWSQHEIICIMAKRIETFFGSAKTQEQISRLSQDMISNSIFSQVVDPTFHGLGHWANRPIHNILTSLVRKRPRDLVKLMQGAGRNAFKNKHSIISSQDLSSSFSSYSNERLQDVINEFKSELPSIEQLLLNMKPSKKERRTSQSYLFSNDQLSAKISDVMRKVNLSFTNGRSVNGRSITQFLYKIDFITARRDEQNKITRYYFDNGRFLANEFTDFGFNWEIHPAYRWALQPQDISDVFASLD